MAASLIDELVAERAGVSGKITVGDIAELIIKDLPQSDLRDEKDATYFYYGWESVNGGWLIQRQLRSQGTSESATTGHVDLSAAWPNRAALVYS